MTSPRTITIDGQTVDIYETQVTHLATGTILWASASGIIACHELKGLHAVARIDIPTGELAWSDDRFMPKMRIRDAYRAAHLQSIGLEMFALCAKARGILERWRADVYDTLAASGDGRCYPCHSEDIPRGAIDTYHPIASSEAFEALVASLREGWKYE